MPRLILLTVMLLSLASFAFAQPPVIKGISLPLTASDPDYDYGPFLKEISATGANWVSLLTPWYQEDHRATIIREKYGKTPSRETLKRTIRQAYAEGLEVMLLPIVLLEDDTTDEWRGSLEPDSLEEWFNGYAERLLPLAQLAEKEGVAMLSVGSEFASLEDDEVYWRQLVDKIRNHYNGELVYTANWDTPDWVTWWDALDYLAISCYYELAEKNNNTATTETLTQGAVKWRDWLLEVRERIAPEHKIILSEIGYPSIDGGAVFPWDYTQKTPVDLEEQRRAFEAFIRAWDGQELLHGCFIYTWVEYRGEPRRGYSPRGKPAEELIRSWYGNLSADK